MVNSVLANIVNCKNKMIGGKRYKRYFHSLFVPMDRKVKNENASGSKYSHFFYLIVVGLILE